MSHTEGPRSKTPGWRSTSGWCVWLSITAAVVIGTLGCSLLLWASQRKPAAVVSSPAEAHYSAARHAQEQKDYAKAEQEYRAAVALAPQFAEAYTNLGLIYQLQGRLPEAGQMLRKALGLKPSLPDAKLLLGINYCRLGHSREAIPYLRTVIREKPDWPQAWVWLATALEMEDSIPEELREIQRGLQLHPQNVDLLYLQGHVFEGLAREYFSRLQNMAPGSAYAEEAAGESYASSGDLSAAVLHLQDALALAPEHPDFHLKLGEVYLQAGNLQSADLEFQAELHLNGNGLSALVRRGETKFLEEDLAAAMNDWSRVVDLDDGRAEIILGVRVTGGGVAEHQLPDSLRSKLPALEPRIKANEGAAAHLAMAFLATQRGENSRASSEMDLAGRTHFQPPRSCSARDLAGWLRADRLRAAAYCGPRALTSRSPQELRMGVVRALYETGDFKQAIELLNAPNAGRPLSTEIIFWRARCYRKLARQLYLQLYEANPNSYRVHQLLGDTFAAQNNDAEAISEYRKALAEEPSLPNVHYRLGQLLFRNLKFEEALSEFEAELKLNPRHAGALLNLGAQYLHEKKPEEALSYLRRALAEDPGNSEIHAYLGRAYMQLRRYPQAEKELKLAAATDSDGSVHNLLGRVYQILGQTQEASSAFAKSNTLLHEAQRRRAEHVQRLNSIEAILKQD